MEREQLESDARAKIIWGDSADGVVGELVAQGLPTEEALAIITAIQRERNAMIRAVGKRKFVTGALLILVPFVVYLMFLKIGFVPMKVFGLTIVVGIYGGWRFITGLKDVLAPNSETGDLSNPDR